MLYGNVFLLLVSSCGAAKLVNIIQVLFALFSKLHELPEHGLQVKVRLVIQETLTLVCACACVRLCIL
jgi:hypothetical protein